MLNAMAPRGGSNEKFWRGEVLEGRDDGGDARGKESKRMECGVSVSIVSYYERVNCIFQDEKKRCVFSFLGKGTICYKSHF